MSWNSLRFLADADLDVDELVDGEEEAGSQVRDAGDGDVLNRLQSGLLSQTTTRCVTGKTRHALSL